MKSTNSLNHHIGRYANPADILAHAMFSEKPEIMCLHELPQEQQKFIATARLQGGRPISVRWPGGKFAILFCEPGTDLPCPQVVIRAYKSCVDTSLTFPNGEVSW